MAAKDFIIVIGRQFGAGGRQLGRTLSSLLNIPYYDKELLSEAAQRLGFNKQVFDDADERRPSILRSLLNFSYATPLADYTASGMDAESLYNAQSQVIRQIADEGPCIIVGRTADYILRNLPNMLSVFVHAPIELRAERICRRGDAACISEALSLAQRRDKLRKEYYNYFSGKRWGHAESYHLSISSEHHSSEALAKIVIAYLDAHRFQTISPLNS